MTQPGGQAAQCCDGTAYCRRCAMRALWQDPEFRARHRAGQEKKLADPAYMEAHRRRSREHILRYHANPANHAQRSANARKALALSRTPEALARQRAGAKRAAAKTVETKLMWCPAEYRALYTELRRKSGLRAPAARKLVEEQIEWDAGAGRREVARREAEMRSRHERDLRDRY